MAETKEVLSFAVELGDLLLRNGAEVYRVEESVIKILESYDISDGDVYVLTNGIFATANEESEDSSSKIRHVPLAPTHLGRISALNNLCREVCNKDVNLEDAWQELDRIKEIPEASQWLLVLATGVGSAGFTYLFGGNWLDAIFSLFIGFLLKLWLVILAKNTTSKAAANILGASLVSILALLSLKTGLNLHYDKIIIGDIMPLVPGIALTTSIRDFVNGDYLSGAIRFIDALLTSFCIAVGVGIVISVAQIFGGGI